MDIQKNIKDLKKRLENLKIMEKRLGNKLENVIEGSLLVYSSKNSLRYIYRHDDNSREYLGSTKNDVIKQLEEKNYYKKLLKAVKDEEVELSSVLERLDNVYDVDRVFFDLPEGKRNLICPYVFIKDETLEKRFNAAKFKGRLEESNYVTLGGEKVRSKSELIIADRLRNADVPYTYEPPTMMDMDFLEIWHPDFLCLNKRTGDEYYWEHFGMLDNSDYREKFQRKLERYAEVDIVLGKNLIITTESSEHQLNTEYIDRLIKEYLV